MTRTGWMAVLGVVLGGWACTPGDRTASAEASSQATTPPAGAADQAVAMLRSTSGSKVQGRVEFVREGDGVHVKAQIDGLAPGEHGFHVHEKGDCSAPDASSAGAHFNPFHAAHAARDAADRHVGDLGNLSADDSGKAQVDFVDARLALRGEASIVGRAVVVHEKRDDLVSQPAGEAGGRLACGVIEAAASK